MCSLDLLSTSFRLVCGGQAGRIFHEGELLHNPIVGLMLGVLATVLVQSSSTSTSVIVTMVGTHLINVRDAVPIIMGTNIGTSITNTVVSLCHSFDGEEFHRAFAGATVHDMFNWLVVIVLLPLEVATGYLEKLTGAIMGSGEWFHTDGGVQKQGFVQTITKPVTLLIVQVDKKILEKIASGQLNETEKISLLKVCSQNGTKRPCGYLLENIAGSDFILGLCLLIVSLLLLCGCLVTLAKVLHSCMGGPVASQLRHIINIEPPWPYHLLTGWVAMALGCALTVLVQSSSVFTSALTPLAGMGLVSLERLYPLTLGSNLGSTATGLLAAFAAPPATIKDTLQIAFCQLFFNLSGIILFYLIPATRLPIMLAKMLGEMSSRYRWFSLLYLLVMFLLLPSFVLGLSVAGPQVFAGVGGPLLVLIVIIGVINVLQRKRPSLLPLKLRDWSFLPEWMHSLDPLDRVIGHICCCPQSERQDSSVPDVIPNQIEMDILQPVSASFPVFTLNSSSVSDPHTLNGVGNSFPERF
ncbi:Sodium-dependent phosphate transport protein like [Argiope bruennichi]|uniref:Sodium-dependent phosphate transport protein like n=1 Tax=Argiope bruennichi TaxID=94029 RepID=A0A8T0FLI5_ARGBR|nr:Sodium-dependent phosphate transport protein like [Argiope bruennichi]